MQTSVCYNKGDLPRRRARLRGLPPAGSLPARKATIVPVSSVGADAPSLAEIARNTIAAVQVEASRPRPYIPTDSPHWAYALLCANGWSHQRACAHLDLCPETARRWRRKLCATARGYFGFEVTYEFAARYATDEAFRRLFAREDPPAGSACLPV